MRVLVAVATTLVAATALLGSGRAASSAALVALANPAWSPTRAEVAVDARFEDSTSEVLIVSPEGSFLRQIEQPVVPTARGGRPLWSPNGNKLGLMGFDGRTPFVAVTSRLGTEFPVRVGFGDATPGSWSPGSARLALNGVDPTNSPVGVAVVSAVPAPRVEHEWAGYAPAWSPHRDVIAFSWGKNKEALAPESDHDFIYTADPNGKHRRRLQRGSNPSWSSDGKLLAYTAPKGVFVMDQNGGAPRLVYDGIGTAAIDIHLRWAPRRRLIAVTFGGRVIVDVAHKRRWPLRVPSSVRGEPSWSPDGRQLVFAAGSRLYIIGADGRGGHYVTLKLPAR